MYKTKHTSFFQYEVIFVQLDELDELYRITHAWIRFNNSLTQVQKKKNSVMVSAADSFTSDLGWIPGQTYEFFVHFILLI